MDVLSRTRHIPCEGSFNLRDLGGYPASDGRTVRWNVLYRADGLHRIPPDRLHTLAPLGWRTVLDLRTTGEVDTGAFRSYGVEVVHLPILRATWGVPDVTEVEPVGFLSSHYLQMLDEGATAIAVAFEILASSGHLPAVFHCSAGKDRTGVLAALVLSSLGVPDEVVADDYQLSATAVERLVAWLEETRPELVEEMARQPKAFLSCPAEAMHVFLAALRDRHGSVEGYLDAIGVGPGVLADLRRSLLEEG